MTLNREQAIEILERFDFFQGQRAGRELWAEKPFEVQEEDLKNFSRDVASLKTFIKELTEKYENLEMQFREIDHECDRLEIRNEELTEENERLRGENAVYANNVEKIAENYYKQGRADTVRKMQERLTTFFNNDDNLKYNEVDAAYINEMIDQIAKEIIGGSYGKKD